MWKKLRVLMVAAAAVTVTAGAQEAVDHKQVFDKVTSELDRGGTFLLFVNSQNWGGGLIKTVDSLEKLALSETSEQEKEDVVRGFNLARKALDNSGLLQIEGLGVSSLAVDDELFRNKVFINRSAGNPGVLWEVIGTESRPLTGLRLLPASTVVAKYGNFDLDRAFTWWETLAQESGIDELKQGYRQALAELNEKQGIDVRKLIKSTAGEMGVLLTANPESRLAMPMGGGAPLEIPDAALAVIIKVKDTQLFDQIAAKLQMPQVQRQKHEEMDMLTMMLPLPLPLRVSPTVAQFGDYLLITSNDSLSKSIYDTYNSGGGLIETEEFQKLAEGLPTEGISFHFISETFGNEIQRIVSQVATGAPLDTEQNSWMRQLLEQGKPVKSFGVTEATEQGYKFTSHSTFSGAKVIMTQASVAPMALAAGMILPAMSKARGTARQVECVNNMKQLTLALHLYAEDNDGTFPETLAEIKPYVGNDEVFSCPSAEGEADQYVYVGGGVKMGELKSPGKTVLIYEKFGNHHQGMAAAFADGHVERLQVPTIEDAVMSRGLILPEKNN